MILIGRALATAVRQLGHQHGEAAIADHRDGLAAGIGETGRNREGDARGYRGKHAGAGEALVRSKRKTTRGKVGIGAAVERDHRVVAEEITERPDHQMGTQ